MSATAAITAIVANTDSGVAATATFTVDGNEVTHTVTLTNCPEGTHGYHIHDGTGCGNDGTDAGGHWNPGNVDHGVWGTDPYHLGDIGNVVCDANGNGTSTMTTTLWTVGDSVAAKRGRADRVRRDHARLRRDARRAPSRRKRLGAGALRVHHSS